MARKPRDYKAEERRRNELARDRGFRTRAEQRYKIEHGNAPALDPKRLRSPRTIKAQALYKQRLGGSAVPTGPVPTFDEIAARYDKRADCMEWSERNAATTVAKYLPDESQRFYLGGKLKGTEINMKHSPWMRNATLTARRKQKWIDKHSFADYTEVYYGAFVNPDTRYSSVRYIGGSDPLFIWFVEITGYMTAEEFESRYGTHVQR